MAGRIAINPDRFDKLITALRTVVDNDGMLYKEATSYNDIFDAFRLALKCYHFRDSSEYDSLGDRVLRSHKSSVSFHMIKYIIYENRSDSLLSRPNKKWEYPELNKVHSQE